MHLVHVQCGSRPRKHCKNASAESLFLCVSKLPVVFSVAVEGRRPVLSMPCRFKYRSVIKFAFMLFTVYAIGALLVEVLTPLLVDHPGQENGLPDIVMETSKENRFLGEQAISSIKIRRCMIISVIYSGFIPQSLVRSGSYVAFPSCRIQFN